MIGIEHAPAVHALLSEAVCREVSVCTLLKEEYGFPEGIDPETTNI